jgi:hypothetical protein
VGRVTTPDDVRFALIAIEESRREVFCHPTRVEAVRALVDELGVGGLVQVHGSPYVPEDQAFVVEPNAMQASLNQALHFRPGDLWPGRGHWSWT